MLEHIRSVRSIAAAFAICSLVACNTIAPFDQAAYDKGTGAKAEALALMGKATGSYTSHLAEIEKVNLTIDKAYEYDKGRSKNAITIQQWEILRDPDKHLFGGFIRRWREKGSLNSEYINEKKKDIADAFDQITGLEIGKRKVQ
jgi:hypothetical protein